ncbi:MAG: hypothetical protein RLZZ401_247 [Pseudomonadota bacterium]|jgi:uncharacterized membrane protein
MKWRHHLCLAVGLAVLTHLAVLWVLPRAIMGRLIRTVQPDATVPHAVVLPPLADHHARRVVMPSPDLLYALCPFDLRGRPVRIQADPRTPHYWSIALYGSNSDNFFVLNDRQAAGAPVDLLLVDAQADAVPTPVGARRVVSPSSQGLLLMRVLAGDYASQKMVVEAARRSLRCTPA